MLNGLLFSFSGRIRRSQWWLVQIAANAFALVTFIVLAVLFADERSQVTPMAQAVTGALMVVGVVTLSWINLATSTKRFHDQGLSGWFNLIGVVPGIGSFVVLAMLGFRDSTRGPNRYGASVKYPDLQTAAVFD